MSLSESLCEAMISSLIQLEWRPSIAGLGHLSQFSCLQYFPPQKVHRNLVFYLKLSYINTDFYFQLYLKFFLKQQNLKCSLMICLDEHFVTYLWDINLPIVWRLEAQHFLLLLIRRTHSIINVRLRKAIDIYVRLRHGSIGFRAYFLRISRLFLPIIAKHFSK